MLLETVVLHKPDVQLKYFEYRARNPQIVNCATTAYGVWQSDHVVDVWSKDEAGVVGMTGVVHVHN
jgi:hydroxyacyl-ACP dehydratase HTD2-like protein with hotdog domain